MLTYPVFFHDWHGTAIRAEGHWWLPPRQLSDHLELSWRRQDRKIQSSDLKAATALRAVPALGQNRQMLTMKLPYFGAWLLSIEAKNVPEAKRPRLVAMKGSLLDALDRQLARLFALPGLAEAEDMEALPLPPVVVSAMSSQEVQAERAQALADPATFTAARLMRLGLPATRVAPVVGRSVYWSRQQQRRLRRIGLVPLTPAQQRLLDQPSLFGEG